MAILTTTCPHCGADPTPLNVIRNKKQRSGNIISFVICPRCDMPAAIVLTRTGRSEATPDWFEMSQAYENHDLAERVKWKIDRVYPPSQQKNAPEHTPPEIARIYRQAVSAHQRSELDAAAILFGKVLEGSVKLLHPELKGTLKQRIDQLVTTERFSPEVQRWADEIRIVRNDAAHDYAEPKAADVNEIAEFTEAFLIFVFTMPKKFENRQSRKRPTAQ